MSPLQRQIQHPGRALLLITRPAVIALAALLFLMAWRVPTVIRIDMLLSPTIPAGELPEKLSRQTTVRALEGKIGFPDFPRRPPFIFKKPVTLELHPADTFQVRTRTVNGDHPKNRVHISGLAEQVESSSKGRRHDHRMTKFDEVSESPRLMLTGMGIWLTLTVIGWYNAYQELKA